MKYLILLIILTGCYKVEKETITGCGVVENTKLVPESKHRSCTTTYDMDHYPSVSCSTHTDPAIYIVYMSWDKGSLESNGTSTRDEEIYYRLRQGDYIFITANAVYHIDGDTKKRTFHGYEFVDAKRDKKCIPPINPEFL